MLNRKHQSLTNQKLPSNVAKMDVIKEKISIKLFKFADINTRAFQRLF